MPWNNETNKFEPNELEKEFIKAQEEARPLIKEKLDLINKLLEEAKSISEHYSVPFDIYIAGCCNTYIPYSIDKMHISYDDLHEIFGIRVAEYDSCPGWQQSYC